MPVAQLLIYPVTDHAMDKPSYRENANAKPLNAAMRPWFWKHYLQNPADGSQPYALPLKAELRGLPPALVITAEFDPLRDEGETYAAHLELAGVPTWAIRYDGVSHEFFGLAGAVGKAKDTLEKAADFLKEAFDARSS